uniref:Uncharacterized protein n=1 Tax=Setaria italica TaxID=4555 RepID=K3Y3H8_SETIT
MSVLANFSRAPGASVPRKSPRFVPNPEKFWGPRPKACRHPKVFHVDKS